MRILALDSSGSACSAALLEDGAVKARRLERGARGQAERLVPMVTEVAAEAGIALASVDLFAATIGPGAFTGLRIGLATLRGLALAAHRPMLGLTSLEAIAAATAAEARKDRRLLVLIESRRAELYAQSFAPDLTPLDAPRAASLEALVQGFAGTSLLLAGDAAARAERALSEAGCDLVIARDAEVPDAAIVATLAMRRAGEASLVPPAPLYLRPADTTLPKTRDKTTSPASACAIVAAGAHHGKALAALHAASFAGSADEIWSADALVGILVQPGAFALVAESAAPDAAAPLGFVLARVAGGEGEILTIATIPDARQRGVGSALLEAALEEMSVRGAASASLEVAADNGAAQALYRRAGFVEVGRRPAYYRNIHGDKAKDALVLRREIAEKSIRR